MKSLPTIAAVLLVSAVVGALTYFVTPAEVVAPLSYDIPVKISAQTETSVTFRTHRCNNTGGDLLVSVTAFWESQDRSVLIPTQPLNAGFATFAPGCTDRGGNPTDISYLPSGTWRLRGSLCTDDFCGGWFSDYVVKP